MQNPNPETVTLNGILITEELSRRASRTQNLQAENQAMRMLIHQMTQDAASLMQTLVDTALELCQAGTTGLSLLETTTNGEEIFRWTALAGTLAHHVGGSTPRNFSPCGVCLDQGVPVLFSHPERYFNYFQAANTPVVEGLVLPLIAERQVFGTIWIMSHDEGRHFDSEDVRIMASLADFTATALLLQQRQTGELLAANAVLETEIVERKQVEAQTQALIANLPGGAVFVVDRNLRYLLAEGEALAAAGFKPEDFVGRTIFEVLPPDLIASYEPMYRQSLTGEPFEHEHHAHHHTYLSRGTPLRSPAGEIYAVLAVSYDITERKRVEDERKKAEVTLRESEARLQSIANLVPDLLWDSEPNGSTNWYNQRWMEYTGQTFEQAIRWGWMDAIHPDDREGSARRYREAVEQGIPLQQEHRIRRHDGAYRWFAVKASPLKDESGKVIKMYGAATDIHDRKQAEDALRQSEEKYRSLFESIDEGFAIVEVFPDEQGCVTDLIYREANEAFGRHSGMRDFIGKRVSEILPNLEQHWLDMLTHIYQTGEPARMENHIAELDRWLDVHYSHVGDADSRQVAVVFEDITQRKRFEQRQAYMLQLSDALRSLADPLVVQEVACRVLGEHLGANRVLYSEMFEDLGSQTLIRVSDYTAGVPSRVGWHRLEDYGEFVMETWRAGRNLLWSSLNDLPNLSAVERAAYEAVEIEAIIGVPLVKEGRFEAFLAVHQATPRKWTADEIALVEETAERTWADVERARAEESLTQSEAKYRSLFNSIDNGFCIIERVPGEQIDFRYLEANPAFAVQTGISDVVGKTIREVAPDVPEAIYQIYGNVLNTGEPIRSEIDVPSLEHILEIYAFRTEDKPRLAVIFKDISDRKRAEQRQAFLFALADRLRPIADPVEVMSTASEALGQYLGVGRCGYGEVDATGEFLIIERDWTDEIMASLRGTLRLDDFGPEFIGAYRAGHTVILNDVLADLRARGVEDAFDAIGGLRASLAVPLVKEGRWVSVFYVQQTQPRQWTSDDEALVREVAERTWATVERARAEAALREAELQRVREQFAREQERQRAEALADLDRAKTLFFSNISHEFRTPLTLLLAPLQDALSDPTLAPIHRERLELARHNSLRLLKLVNTLLDFSRIEAGRIEAVYEPTDLAQLTTDLASVFRSAIERAGLRLIVDCPPLPEPVYVDREMWEKIVLNLLSNALKFTFTGDITLRLYSDDHQAVLQIQDTGTGIAPEHLPHLFERFYQIRGEQARTHEGSGIGLALVDELVQLQGGAISVTSTVGEGTCFTILLPFGTAHLPSERIQSTRTLTSTALSTDLYVQEAERWLPEERGRVGEWEGNGSHTLTSRILIVDDNADMRQYLTRTLSEYVQVEAVADGEAALAAIQAQSPDLVLSDVMMPRLDGFGLLQTLRSDPRTREIPVILLSARAGEEAITEGLNMGADDYLIKPFSAQELISRVNAHLQISHLRGEALHEARTAIRRKDELLSVVSHELNTPLVSILGWTRLLRANPPNSAMLSTALDTIERSATMQAKLVQDLLDVSRITAGKLRLNLQPLALESVIEGAIATVTQLAAEAEIHLVWTETATAVVMGDRERLQQVVCNLLTNAIKFTPAGGRIEVHLSLVTAHQSLTEDEEPATNDRYAEIRVIDTGMGIDADFLPHVFEQFRQAGGTHSAKGLGLGLAIAHHIVELHNGTIQAQSAGEGQGATFTIRFPLLQPNP